MAFGDIQQTTILFPVEEYAILYDDLLARDGDLGNFDDIISHVEGVPMPVRRMRIGMYLGAAIHAENYNYKANNSYKRILIEGKSEKLPIAEKNAMQLGYVALRDYLEDFEDPDGYFELNFL